MSPWSVRSSVTTRISSGAARTGGTNSIIAPSRAANNAALSAAEVKSFIGIFLCETATHQRSSVGSPVASGGTSAISSVPAKIAPIAGNTERATVAIGFLNMAEAK